jgi:hypothetical protein
MTFQRISSNGASAGVLLNNTGPNNALTVTGAGGTCTNADTSGCTGGQIQNTTGANVPVSNDTPAGSAVVMNNIHGVSLTRMHIHDHANYGIRGNAMGGFTLADSVHQRHQRQRQLELAGGGQRLSRSSTA